MAEATQALRCRGVSVDFGGRAVLREVDLAVWDGQLVALVGPNGAGKSTLLRTLAGLNRPAQGSVEVRGVPIHRWPPRERARTLAYVPQRTRLQTPLRVREVVAQGRAPHRSLLGSPSAVDRRAVDESLERCQLGDLSERAFTELSEGEARRVLIGRSLASGARLLLLDEPTAALDLRHALELFQLLSGLRDDGFALVVVLHDLGDAARFADHAVVLREGAVSAEGPARDLLSAPLVREVWGVVLEEGLGPRFRLPDGKR